MIRRALLLSVFLPFAASAQVSQVAAGAATPPPCGAPALAPMPATVPVPEMMHAQAAAGTCINLLSYTERRRRPAVAPGEEAAYVPKTQFDNTPWRFNMTQNGRQMTAAEFDAWMKAKGIRVARGAASTTPAGATVVPVGTALPAPPAAAAPAPAPATTGCVPSATVTC